MHTPEYGTLRVKTGLAEMLKGGVIMDVVDAEQARIAEEAGACAVMALERVPADIRRDGAPLIEAVPGEPNYSWVTFLWQAAGKTTNVAVVDGVAAPLGDDPGRLASA